ncbi:MAG: hypothetical protein J0I06_13530 [Planctomycetes bacterium]|nr:hypothetical protein [Planctomycetota bacterium]
MHRRTSRAARLVLLLPVFLCALCAGCGGGNVYRVSGKVTFQGKPVPAGKIYFIPDGSKGNTGPTGYADIKNGEYDTGAPGGSHAPAGPVIIAVEGQDPSAPLEKKDKTSEDVAVKVLFPRYEVPAELPKEKSTKDVEVPGEAAKGMTGPPRKAGEVVP